MGHRDEKRSSKRDLTNVATILGAADFVVMLVGGALWHEEALPGYTLDNGYRALAVIAVVVAMVAFVIARRQRAPRALAWALGVVPLASIPLFLAAHALNRYADRRPPHDESAEVLAVEQPKRGVVDHVTFRRPDHEPQTINLFKPPGVHGALRLIVHPGLWGWEWAEVPQPD